MPVTSIRKPGRRHRTRLTTNPREYNDVSAPDVHTLSWETPVRHDSSNLNSKPYHPRKSHLRCKHTKDMFPETLTEKKSERV